MKILVRLPNWLGDLVMSVGFLNQIPHFFPNAQVSIIVKKGIHEILPFFPPTIHQYIFDKEVNIGMKGLVRFGKDIRQSEHYDLFFCLPDSFSSAVMASATGAVKRIGYRKELRQLLLTEAYPKSMGLHRVHEYIQLLVYFTHMASVPADVSLHHQQPREDYMVVNINSEASSRRLTVTKAVELLTLLRERTDRKIIMIGAPRERELVEKVLSQMGNTTHIENAAGQTSLRQLASILAGAQVMLTTDSGPAHLANALGTHTVVLFGAGNENKTAPFNVAKRTIIRLGELSCEPCEKNICSRYATPQCLERLHSSAIIETVINHLS